MGGVKHRDEVVDVGEVTRAWLSLAEATAGRRPSPRGPGSADRPRHPSLRPVAHARMQQHHRRALTSPAGPVQDHVTHPAPENSLFVTVPCSPRGHRWATNSSELPGSAATRRWRRQEPPRLRPAGVAAFVPIANPARSATPQLTACRRGRTFRASTRASPGASQLGAGAGELSGSGHNVAVPSLSGGTDGGPPYVRRLVRQACAQGPGQRGGPGSSSSSTRARACSLPTWPRAVAARKTAVIFADASIPPQSGRGKGH